MTSWIAIFAEGEANPAGIWAYLPYLVLGLMVVMFIRSTSKQKRAVQESLNAIKKNDKVVTSGGILGVVVAIKENEDEVTLKVDDTSNTRIRVLKSSIVRIISDPATGETKP